MNILKSWLQKFKRKSLKEIVSMELTLIRREKLMKKNADRMYYTHKYGENFTHFIK